MKLIKHSLNEILEVKNNKEIFSKYRYGQIEPLFCPICNEKTFFINKSYKFASCENKECLHYTLPLKKTNSNSFTFDPIIKESLNHLNSNYIKRFINNMKINSFDEYNIGYLPNTYWLKKSEEWSFGRMTFPMVDFNNQYNNICGLALTSDYNKNQGYELSFAHTKVKNSIFNLQGFFYEEIICFSNPLDCLYSIQKGFPNSIFTRFIFEIPKEFYWIENIKFQGFEEKDVIINNIKERYTQKIEIG